MSGLIKKDLIYADLSYKTLGVLFDVWKNVGYGHKEKIYQSAALEGFNRAGIKAERELPVKIIYNNKTVGLYYFDFLVDDKMVLELKVRNYFSKKDIDQLYSYLKAKNLKLGIIAHFTRRGVEFKRVVNIEDFKK